MDLIKRGLQYDKTTKQWTTTYPWIRNVSELPNNYTAAFGQLRSLEKRLKRSSDDYLQIYSTDRPKLVQVTNES